MKLYQRDERNKENLKYNKGHKLVQISKKRTETFNKKKLQIIFTTSTASTLSKSYRSLLKQAETLRGKNVGEKKRQRKINTKRHRRK